MSSREIQVAFTADFFDALNALCLAKAHEWNEHLEPRKAVFLLSGQMLAGAVRGAAFCEHAGHTPEESHEIMVLATEQMAARLAELFPKGFPAPLVLEIPKVVSGR